MDANDLSGLFPGTFVAQTLKLVLEWMSIPVLVIALQLPHGTLLYWLSNSCFSIASNLIMRHPAVSNSLQFTQLRAETLQESGPTKNHASIAEEDKIPMPPELYPLLMKAAKLRADNKKAESLEVLEEITSAYGHHPQGHYAKAQLLSEMKQWDKAANSYTSAAELVGDVPHVRKIVSVSDSNYDFRLSLHICEQV